jgi:hypothetical protein
VSVDGLPTSQPYNLGPPTCSPVSRPAIAISDGGAGVVAWQASRSNCVQARLFTAVPRSVGLPISGVTPTLPQLISDWRGHLSDRRMDVTTRRTAAGNLACMRGEATAAFGDLVTCLEDDTVTELRADCAEGVAAVAANVSVAVPPLLVSLADDEAPEVRSEAAEAIGSLGPEARSAAPALVAALEDPSPQVRGSAGLALGLIGADAAAEDIAKVLRAERSSSARTGLVKGIGHLARSEEAFARLAYSSARCRELISDWQSRRRLHDGLEEFLLPILHRAYGGDRSKIDRALAAAHSRLERDRVGVFETRDENAHRPFYEVIDKALGAYFEWREARWSRDVCPCVYERAWGLVAVESFPDWAESRLASLVDSYDAPPVCAPELLRIVETVGGNRTQLGAAIRRFLSMRGLARPEAAHALVTIDPQSDATVTALTLLLDDPGADVRAETIRALTSSGPTALSFARERLETLLDDSSPTVRGLAESALDLIEREMTGCDEVAN